VVVVVENGDEMAGETKAQSGDGWTVEAGRACMRDYACTATRPSQPPTESRVLLGAAAGPGLLLHLHSQSLHIHRNLEPI